MTVALLVGGVTLVLLVGVWTNAMSWQDLLGVVIGVPLFALFGLITILFRRPEPASLIPSRTDVTVPTSAHAQAEGTSLIAEEYERQNGAR
jgi:hypothetical protein